MMSKAGKVPLNSLEWEGREEVGEDERSTEKLLEVMDTFIIN